MYTTERRTVVGQKREARFGLWNWLTVTEYREYERKLRNYRDWKNTIVTAKKMAYERGFKEGMAEKLKERNVPIEEIIERTGLSEQEIAAL